MKAKHISISQRLIDNDEQVIYYREHIKRLKELSAYMRELGLKEISRSVNKDIIDQYEAMELYIRGLSF